MEEPQKSIFYFLFLAAIAATLAAILFGPH
jgi:hypothetical protein